MPLKPLSRCGLRYIRGAMKEERKMTKQEPILFLDDHRGQYIPRDFAVEIKREAVSGVTAEQWAILEHGPDGGLDSKDGINEHYWDVWADVCDRATIKDGDVTYTIYQDGACWLIPDGFDDPEFFGV
jgi:hypothetical protein